MNLKSVARWTFLIAIGLVLGGASIFAFREFLTLWLVSIVEQLPGIGELLREKGLLPLEDPQEQISTLGNLGLTSAKVGLLLLCASSFDAIARVAKAFEGLRPRLTRRRLYWILPLILLTAYVIAVLATGSIEFGSGKEGLGYGHDGARYGRIAEEFRPFETTAVQPFSSRILPAVAIHYLDVGTFRGFRLTNFVSYFLACILLYHLIRLYGFDRLQSILGMCLFIFLKFGLKFWVYYPILTDGFGTLLLMGVLYGAVSGRHVPYLICMTLAVFSRDNILVLIPFHFLCALHRGSSARQLVTITLINLVPLVCLVVSRAYPLLLDEGGRGAILTILNYLQMFLFDPSRQASFVLGLVNSLGILAIMPVLCWRASYRFLAEHRHWIYFLALNLAMSAFGGHDIDRFALWQAPLLILLVLNGLSVLEKPMLLLYLVVVQLVWSELLMPWPGDVHFYLSRYAANSKVVDFFLMELSCLALLGVVVAGFVHYMPRRAGAKGGKKE